MKIILLSLGLLTSLSPLSFATEYNEIDIGAAIANQQKRENGTVRGEKNPFLILEEIKKIEEQEDDLTKRLKAVDHYVSNLPYGQKLILDEWHQSQELSQKSKKFLVVLGKMTGFMGTGKKLELHVDAESLFLNMAYIDRANALHWLDNPSSATDKDEEVIRKIGQKKADLINENYLPEKVNQELDIFLDMLTLDEQFQAMHWLNYPPAYKGGDLDIMKLIDGQSTISTSFGTELPTPEEILAYKWFKQKEREKHIAHEKLVDMSFNVSPDSLVDESCIIL